MGRACRRQWRWPCCKYDAHANASDECDDHDEKAENADDNGNAHDDLLSWRNDEINGDENAADDDDAMR